MIPLQHHEYDFYTEHSKKKSTIIIKLQIETGLDNNIYLHSDIVSSNKSSSIYMVHINSKVPSTPQFSMCVLYLKQFFFFKKKKEEEEKKREKNISYALDKFKD